MKILITGATGFIGNHVIKSLLLEGVEIVASSLNKQKAKEFDWYNKVQYVPFNIDTITEDSQFEEFNNLDVVIHLAWGNLDDFKNQKHCNEIYRNHLSFLTKLIRNGIPKVLVLGTCLEYGMQEGCLSENITVNPELPYAIGKNMLRESLEQLQNEISFELDWLRLFYLHGEGQSSKSILSQLRSAVKNKLETFNMSGGQQLRDYMPVEKVVEVIVKLAMLKHGNGIVNCCSGKPIKIVDLVRNYLKENNDEIELNLGFYPCPDYEPFEFWGDVSKLKSIINE